MDLTFGYLIFTCPCLGSGQLYCYMLCSDVKQGYPEQLHKDAYYKKGAKSNRRA